MGAEDAWDPDQYQRFQAERSAPFFDLLRLVEQVDAPRIADLGCGTGELTAEAAVVLGARSAVGVDSSAAMLARAQEHASGAVSFAEGDIARVASVVSGPFDVLLSNAALHWVPDHARVLAEWTEMLAPAGQLVVQVPTNSDHPSHIISVEVARERPFSDALGAKPPADPSARVAAPEVYARILFDLGYPRQHVRLQVYTHLLGSTADVVEWVKGTSLTRFELRLGPELFERFVDRYRTRLLEVLGDQRPYLYTFKRVLFWGRRP
jgi:trans-aconitate 2-methyltransferase